MIKIAETKEVMQDGKMFPVVRIAYLEKIVDAAVISQSGIHSSPERGAPALLICLDGNEAKRMIIPLSSFARNKDLKEGETEVGNFKVSSTIKFDENGNVNIVSSKDVDIQATQVTLNCDIIVTGGDVVADGVSLKTHTHGPGSFAAGGDPVTGESDQPS